MSFSRTSTAGLFRGAGLLLLTLLLLSPLLYYPFARDHGMYMVVAETMSRGGIPYADAWDLKTPGIFFVFRTALSLFGRDMWGVRVIELLFLAGTALALSRLGRRLFPDWATAGPMGAAFFLLFAAFNLNYWHTAQAESFLMLPLVLGIDFALIALAKPGNRQGSVAAALSGICMAVVFVFKFPNILPVACCLPLIVTMPSSDPEAGQSSRFHRLLPVFIWYTAGTLLPLAVVASWFAASGAWDPMVETLFVFAPRYAGITASSGLLAHGVNVFTGFFMPGSGLLMLKWLCLAGLVICLRSKKNTGRFVLPLWFILSLAVIWVQGKFFLYHYLPLYLPCALLAGVAVAAIARGLSSRVRGSERAQRRVKAFLIAFLLVMPFQLDAGTLMQHWREARQAAPVTAHGKDLSIYSDGTDFSLAADLEVADYLRQNTGPDDTLFIWGYETLVYFLAERQQASRFVTHQPLASTWQMPKWREELMTDLVGRPPARILVIRNDAMPAVTGSILDSAGLLREFPELERFISRHYRLETTIEDFLVYSQLEQASQTAPIIEGSTDDKH